MEARAPVWFFQLFERRLHLQNAQYRCEAKDLVSLLFLIECVYSSSPICLTSLSRRKNSSLTVVFKPLVRAGNGTVHEVGEYPCLAGPACAFIVRGCESEKSEAVKVLEALKSRVINEEMQC